MSALAILGYAVIAIGVLIGIWGGVGNPLNLSTNAFMTYLVSAGVLVTVGLALVGNAPTWLLLVALWVTAALALGYLFQFQWQVLVFALCGVVVLAIAAWLTVVIVR